MDRICILHPGEMGISVAASALNHGHKVYWVPAGRSAETRARAEAHGLVELDSLREMSRQCESVISVCPPHAALEVAQAVMKAGFTGLYLDANAISPQRTRWMAEEMEARGISYVDGGIIGGPAWKPDTTWLYLSGRHADRIAACFEGGPLAARIIGDQPGRASALKMCYAAYSKGTSALLATILAAAESFAVLDDLYGHWEMDEEGFSVQVKRRAVRVTRKAWRFEGEMREIAATFREAGLPDGFHQAAAEVYRRMSGYKDRPDTPELDEVLGSLLSNP